jgi:hypothetical protein
MSCKVGEVVRCGVLTSHTWGLGGFCGPGGSVVDGRCSCGSREAAGEEGPPLGGEYCSICRQLEVMRETRGTGGGNLPVLSAFSGVTHSGQSVRYYANPYGEDIMFP